MYFFLVLLGSESMAEIPEEWKFLLQLTIDELNHLLYSE